MSERATSAVVLPSGAIVIEGKHNGAKIAMTLPEAREHMRQLAIAIGLAERKVAEPLRRPRRGR